ncbi:hypothetical protein BJY01DRAFT_242394 [Aspergillus pseudoustus]|uniref:SnoaL-like domain-containing protein n=1 Tax=Aspergillus pseudoustus TaxID=1810923 RepID=A0ABR4L1D2_9EURO
MANLNQPGTMERTIAITEIESTLNRYCIMARENAPFSEMAAQLFVPKKGVFKLPNGEAVAPADMGTVVRGKPPTFIRHHLTSVDIEFTGVATAKTKSYFFAVTGPSGIDHSGYWEDEFESSADGRWLIASRQIVVEMQATGGWFATAYEE